VQVIHIHLGSCAKAGLWPVVPKASPLSVDGHGNLVHTRVTIVWYEAPGAELSQVRAFAWWRAFLVNRLSNVCTHDRFRYQLPARARYAQDCGLACAAWRQAGDVVLPPAMAKRIYISVRMEAPQNYSYKFHCRPRTLADTLELASFTDCRGFFVGQHMAASSYPQTTQFRDNRLIQFRSFCC